MSEKIKTAVMEIIKAHMDGEDKNTKAVLSDVMKSVNELETLEQEPCTDAVSRGVFEQVMRERDIAIEQLHELGYEFGQKIEPCDDAISREDALKLIYDFKEKHTEDREKHPINYGTLLDLIRLIRELPSVTQKSETVTEFADRCRECGKMRKGHWIHLRGDMYECSECGKIHTSFEIGECDADYCPNCGAKMESEVNNE